MKKDKNDNQKSAGEGITEFIQKNRKLFFVITIILVLSFIISIVTFYLFDVSRKKAILAVEELGIRYEDLQGRIRDQSNETEEYEAEDTEDTIEITQENESDESVEIDKELNELLVELEDFAKSNSGYAGGRAWWLIGSIYTEKEDWENAEAAWVMSAETASKTYLAPLAFFRAGAAAEQQGKTGKAIEYYSSSLSTPEDFPDTQRAQFSIGRLNESIGNNEAAKTAYTELITNNKYDTPWVNLAHSRLIALEIIEQSLYNEDIYENE